MESVGHLTTSIITMGFSATIGQTDITDSKGPASGTGGNHGSGSTAYRTVMAKDGSYALMVLRNLYSPKLDANKMIDLTYFHGICQVFYLFLPDSISTTSEFLCRLFCRDS